MKHTCHARNCDTECKPELLMCPRHWRMVPGLMKANVYATYRKGQTVDREPSRAWLDAARAAINRVAEIEATNAST